jgi:ankyrin repeat protein
MMAVGLGNLAMVEGLLQAGANPYMYLADKDGKTPQHFAAHVKHITEIEVVVRLLLAAGADPNALATNAAAPR